jgi:hypothetical protein
MRRACLPSEPTIDDGRLTMIAPIARVLRVRHLDGEIAHPAVDQGDLAGQVVAAERRPDSGGAAMCQTAAPT